jgi:two-component system, OmpR family, response regulator
MTVGEVRDESHLPPRWTPATAADEQRTRSIGIQLLIVDPDDAGREVVVSGLGAEGVSVTWCTSAVDALIEYGRLDPDAVIVTTLLDSIGAHDFVKAVRRHDSRLVLVGLDLEAAESAGPLFLAGAAAAVARPYEPDEVMARLVAHTSDLDSRARITFGDIELDPRAYEVRLAGGPVDGMPLKEFELLRVLMVHANSVVATDTIRDALWGNAADAPSSNAIAVHAARLRTRLEGHARLTRVRGRGYRLSRN